MPVIRFSFRNENVIDEKLLHTVTEAQEIYLLEFRSTCINYSAAILDSVLSYVRTYVNKTTSLNNKSIN